ncbi:hypothetical protein H0266_12590 [Halobacillus locisalis]|uniref:SCP-2 sterol transfer family protein n=1 Tax=Halobacillus locisalis TaxID=220753 RepID=A0A838CUY0_9BACI|nr:hypothetical protein [Halobacillus locisalis]MBA2175731.1 hypothetical protein [Halobacillus locisalis]
MNRVNRRRDLTPLLRECELILKGDGAPVRLSINHSGVCYPSSPKNGFPKVSISTTDFLLISLFKGEMKLFTDAGEDIQCSGTMKNMLFVESLLYLSK